MLNELYNMQRGLGKIGKLPAVKHNDIKSPGMGITFRILLKSDGDVERAEWIDKDKIKDTWSIGNGNKNQFPAIKLTFPLIPGAHVNYARWKKDNKSPKEKAYRKFIREQIEKYSLDLDDIKRWPSYVDKIAERKELLSKNNEDENFYQIFERYSKAEDNGVNILRQAYQLMIEAIDNSDLKSLSAISNTLFGTELDNKGVVKDGKRVTFLLDAIPSRDIDHYASSRREVPAISKALFDLESEDAGKISTCALTGDVCNVVEKVFPEEKLSVVGSTKLYAKNSGTSGPTVKRYDHAGTESYPVSDELSKKLAASIAFLSSEKYQGITWSKIPSSTGSSPSLLLAYCKDDFGLAVPQLITGNSDIEDFEDYLDVTKTVLDLFDKSNCTPDAIVEIAEIIVLDKANRKINYSTTSTLEDVRLAAQEWGAAGNNTPNFKLQAQVAKNKKLYSPWSLSPSSCVAISRNIFKKEGVTVKEVMLKKNNRKVKPPPSIGFPDIMRLFFSNTINFKQLAKRCLLKLSSQYEPLLSHSALSNVQYVLDEKSRVKVNHKVNTKTLNAVTLMAVLLYKIGRNKEVYMNDFAYQMGQLCSAMDELHIGYCKSERKGDIPNTLLGNQVYGMALQNPKKALEFMATRRRPYDSWVKRIMARNTRSEDKAITAAIFAQIWMSKQAKSLSEFLTKQGQVNSDTYKAELMLGYLAGRPFEGKSSQSNTKESQGEK